MTNYHVESSGGRFRMWTFNKNNSIIQRRCLSLIPNSYMNMYSYSSYILNLMWLSHPISSSIPKSSPWLYGLYKSSPNARCMALDLALQPWLVAAPLLGCHHRAFLLGLPAPLAQPFTLGTPWSSPMAVPENGKIKPPIDGHVNGKMIKKTFLKKQ